MNYQIGTGGNMIDIAGVEKALPQYGDMDWDIKINDVLMTFAKAIEAVTGMSNPLVECEHCGRAGAVGHSCWSCGASVRVVPRVGESESRYYFPDGHGGGEILLGPDHPAVKAAIQEQFSG